MNCGHPTITMDAMYPTLRKMPKRVRKHARLSGFFHGDSTISHWFFNSTENTHDPPVTGRRYSWDEQYHSSPLRRPSSTRSVIDPVASPNIGSDRVERIPRGHFWSDVERRVALPFPWITGHVAVTHASSSPRVAPGGNRWAWIRSRRSEGKPASRTCFPSIGDEGFRLNLRSSLISGGILLIILIICN